MKATLPEPEIVKPDAARQFVAIRTASLDDPSWFNPQMDVDMRRAAVGSDEIGIAKI